MSRLEKTYHESIRPQLMKDLAITNIWAVPRMTKVVVNMGVGEASANIKLLDAAMNEMGAVTGQRPVMRRAKKSIAAFKIREGQPVGASVTLRGKRMYEFLDRLISVVIPRIRDFRGLPRKSFDGRGNYSMGLADQIVFPEIRIDDVEFVQGMDITINVRNSDDEKSLALLTEFGFPFKHA